MWTLQDAKNQFSAVVDAALSGLPQEVSRRGKPAVVVLSVADFHRLKDAAGKQRGTFAGHLLGLSQDLTENSFDIGQDVAFKDVKL